MINVWFLWKAFGDARHVVMTYVDIPSFDDSSCVYSFGAEYFSPFDRNFFVTVVNNHVRWAVTCTGYVNGNLFDLSFNAYFVNAVASKKGRTAVIWGSGIRPFFRRGLHCVRGLGRLTFVRFWLVL